MARKPVTTTLSEAEQRLPEYLQTYTGYMDDEANVKWTERQWRSMRRKWLGQIAPVKLHVAGGETLLRDALAFIELVISNDRAKGLHDRARSLGAAMETALDHMKKVNDKRRDTIAKVHTKMRETGGYLNMPGRPKVTYKVTDGNGHSQLVKGLAAVAKLTGHNPATIAVQLSQTGGHAWLGRRNPETSWTVDKIVGTQDA